LRASIRFIAMNSDDPQRMADYFTGYFGLRVLAQDATGAIALTDGWFKLALLPSWPANEVGGIAHYGLAVDDIAALKARIAQHGGTIGPDAGGDFHGEYRIADPFGGQWSISARTFGMDDAGRDVHGIPRIRHTAIYTAKPQPVLDWMEAAFGLQEINVSQKIRTLSTLPLRMCGDGQCNFTILPFDFVSHFGLENQRAISAEHRAKQWVPQHFGWVIPDLMNLCGKLPEGRKDMTLMPENMGEYSAIDPDGNRMDITGSKGFEVTFNVWERADGRGGPPPFIMVRNEKGERVPVSP
jgi:catechol 2,3-dioxygenase-like lactoylglutathione lyase family enzyme